MRGLDVRYIDFRDGVHVVDGLLEGCATFHFGSFWPSATAYEEGKFFEAVIAAGYRERLPGV